jgi:hypothetical protein
VRHDVARGIKTPKKKLLAIFFWGAKKYFWGPKKKLGKNKIGEDQKKNFGSKKNFFGEPFFFWEH